MRRHHQTFIVVAAALAMIAAAVARAQAGIWPLPLRLPGPDQWWFWLFVFFPLIVFPLNVFPKLAMPLLFTLGGIGIAAMIVTTQPDAMRCIVAICVFLGAFLIFDPRLLGAFRWILGRMLGRQRRRGRKDPPAEFSPAMVPRGPRKPSPLVAYARSERERNA